MDQMRIRGGNPLRGKIHISGAKNAALPLLTASLLTDEKLVLSNVPQLADIITLTRLLEQHGAALDLRTEQIGHTVELHAKEIISTTAPYDLVRKMRASILVLGPILARCHKAKVSLPGGCAIGSRPVDLHISALKKMGAEIELVDGYIEAKAPDGLKGAEITFPVVTVTGTENIMMAATLAKGKTTLINAAREPEVNDLAECLMKMGAQIEGIGSDRVVITGVDRLHGAEHPVIADRIEAGTFAMAAAMTDGDVELLGARMDCLESVVETLAKAGVLIEETENGLRARRAESGIRGVDIMTEPYPGFPTDLQAQVMALMCISQDAAMITETIFENRFMHVPELVRMGANINVHGSSAMVRGVTKLKGAQVMATDLRASVSLVMAGLVAEGDTILNRIYHLDRGYERLEEKLGACGAEIERIKIAD